MRREAPEGLTMNQDFRETCKRAGIQVFADDAEERRNRELPLISVGVARRMIRAMLADENRAREARQRLAELGA